MVAVVGVIGVVGVVGVVGGLLFRLASLHTRARARNNASIILHVHHTNALAIQVRHASLRLQEGSNKRAILALVDMAGPARARGDFDSAVGFLDRAADMAADRETIRSLLYIEILMGRALVDLDRGEAEACAAAAARARAMLAELFGSSDGVVGHAVAAPDLVALCDFADGEVARLAGAIDDARRLFRRGISLLTGVCLLFFVLVDFFVVHVGVCLWFARRT